MTTQEIYISALDLIADHGLPTPTIIAHEAFGMNGTTYAVSVIGLPKMISTKHHKSAFKALFELNTLLTEMKAKSCTKDTTP